MIIQKYNFLPPEARHIRETVFVKEQGFNEEFDTIDESCTHLVMFDGDIPVATCRFFWDEEKGSYLLGRLAVMKNYRGKSLGKKIVEEAEKIIKENGGKELMLHSQCRAEEFYSKQGFTAFGEVDYDEDCPHIWMKKSL